MLVSQSLGKTHRWFLQKAGLRFIRENPLESSTVSLKSAQWREARQGGEVKEFDASATKGDFCHSRTAVTVRALNETVITVAGGRGDRACGGNGSFSGEGN